MKKEDRHYVNDKIVLMNVNEIKDILEAGIVLKMALCKLDSILNENRKDAYIDVEYDYDNDESYEYCSATGCEISVRYSRLENDVEYNKRMDKAAKAAETKKKNEDKILQKSLDKRKKQKLEAIAKIASLKRKFNIVFNIVD